MVSPRVSVIVPFYNSEKTLLTCLNSLSVQTLKDIEIVLIDDGSSDDGFAVAKDFAEEYKGSCVLLSQTNKGPSAARNRGLDVAKGEFVAFVDSDDIVDPTMYEKMVANADKYNSDIVSCGRVNINSETGERVKEKIPHYEVLRGNVGTNPSIAKRVSPLMCDKIFRRSVIEKYHLRLDEDIRHAEDYLFSSRYRLHTRCVSAVSEALYVYKVSNSDSLSGGSEHVMDIPEACGRIVDLYRNEGVLSVVSDELMFVFAGYYLRKCKVLSSDAAKLLIFKDEFRKLFNDAFGFRWIRVVAARACREEQGAGKLTQIVRTIF